MQRRRHELNFTSPRSRGEVGLHLAMRSIVQRNPGEGELPLTELSPSLRRPPLTPTLSSQAGRGSEGS